jgi:LacI family transcriptional regulator
VRKPAERSTRNLSIYDVAKEAGVSIATVSRVLNGKDRVASSTRQKVEKAMKRLDFRPNRQARALGLRRTNTIGLVLPDLHGEFFSELIRGVDTAARQANLNVIITRAIGADEEKAITEELIGSGAVDGLIFMITELDDRAIVALKDYRHCLLVIDREVGEHGIDNVLVDNRSGGYVATKHLIDDAGVRQLIFVGGPRDNVDTRDRRMGFQEAIREAGITVPEENYHFTSYQYEEGLELGQALAKRLRGKGRWGIVAANDNLARGLIDSLLELGLSIPGDVAVVGFDDSQLARLTRPAVTSVRVPLQELGSTALRLLVDRLNGLRTEATTMVFKGRLIRRASSLPANMKPDAA